MALASGIERLDCDSYFAPILNKCADKEHHNKTRTSVGWGGDFPLWINDDLVIMQEGRQDWVNGHWSTYTVIQPQMDKGVIQHLGEFTNSIFENVFGFFSNNGGE